MAANRDELRDRVLGNVSRAVASLQACADFSLLMPEVRVNIVYALPRARGSMDVATIQGRITVVNGYPRASGLPAWGASDHMARMVIEARRQGKEVNAGINFRCDKTVIDVVRRYARQKRLKFGWIDRTREPKSAADVDGKSIAWKMEYLVKQDGSVPDLFYEGEGWGKEPLFFALGADAVSVVETAKDIAGRYRLHLASVI